MNRAGKIPPFSKLQFIDLRIRVVGNSFALATEEKVKLTYLSLLFESLKFGLACNIKVDFVLSEDGCVAVGVCSTQILISTPSIQGQQRV